MDSTAHPPEPASASSSETPTAQAAGVAPETGSEPASLAEQNTQALQLVQVYARLHGLQLDLAQLQHQFADGAHALGLGHMLRVLQSLGFQTKLVRGAPERLSTAPLPLLTVDVHGRFFLLGKVQGDTVVVQRAGAVQPEVLSQAQLVQLWAGQWIEASRPSTLPGQTRVGLSSEKFGVHWFWQSLKKYKQLMGEVLLASFFVQILALLTPLIFQVVIDKVLTHRSLTTLDVMVMALLGVSIFEVVLGGMRHYIFSHTTNRVDVELGSKLFAHLLRLPLSYFESRRSGDTVARMRELDNARSFMTGQALTAWLDLFFALVFISVMFYYSASLTFMVLAALPVFWSVSWLMTPLLRSKLEDKFAVGAQNQAFLVETVTSMETLKSQAVEPYWQREWERRLADYVRVSFESGHLGQATQQWMGLSSKILTALLLWFGARQVIDGALTVGGLIAFNMLAGRVNAPILKLASMWQEFMQMKVSIKRLADIMDAQLEPMFEPGRSTPAQVVGRVTLDRVSFRYAPGGPEILKDVSVDIQPGEIVGVVGISGAGKTTLMRLIQRLYTPESGRLLIDGVDVGLVDTSWLRRHIGVVGQDTQLFNRSVRENIALSDPGLSMERVMQAAQLAGAHAFILELPQGYDTLVGERGSRLSGGQRARIAIARALATQPRILLLDEATASLDYESERLIHDHMQRIAADRTVLMVAHRLSSLRLASRILVLEQGRLVDQGSHADLMARPGRYRDLYQAHQVLDARLNAAAQQGAAAGAQTQQEVAHV